MDPRVITRLVGHRGGVMAIAYSPVDGNVLASGGEFGEVFIWDVAKGNRRVLKAIHPSGTMHVVSNNVMPNLRRSGCLGSGPA